MTLIVLLINWLRTKYSLFKSLIGSKNAFGANVADSQVLLLAYKTIISNSLFASYFWQKISNLKEIFLPIHLA